MEDSAFRPRWRNTGICLAHGHQLGAAEPSFRRLFDLQPHDWHNRSISVLFVLTGRNTAAVETLKPIVDGPAAQVDALNLIAAAYEANHETPAATEALPAMDLGRATFEVPRSGDPLHGPCRVPGGG